MSKGILSVEAKINLIGPNHFDVSTERAGNRTDKKEKTAGSNP
ncbi:hypothetical protein P4C99_15110 [Pontiellaceae bacterium B1224]|nr:hypothetical protein [Pontiellaceae bacterium B1224]